MSKAEERELEAIHLKIDGDSRGYYDINELNRQKFLLGYHQAEKDLEIAREEVMEKVCRFLDGYAFMPTYVINDLKKAMKNG